ncbi:50S ribosomal protein L29 [Myroides marinus]|jgi:large subunit ribosomal protein L29|uniref:Large ribosomal subunit protein uL29 n=1 Tax=Myroides marinus TaxID=703342 RepID=A0A161S7E7_9FLAO|nr:50S ribosomal protein L29 [Myroides marinus]KZE75305.1 50S ribosomal protein L29 [Myroides marinus]MDM1348506.1 50S ribosomal protein L29 [Myroides marinus]MDM1349426.1 50S ribosomal protein L29 [Myroides marinus]MDM1355602.1 50S ribosomal protein L29 [Myroides marinus]MDM1356636.1 50S ribosomal protein L29 [Myroides marinus]
MKQSEIVNLSVAELQEQLVQLTNTYNNLRSAHAISPIENPLQLKVVRRSIARVNTELSKRELQ